jgi:hypothetical protein
LSKLWLREGVRDRIEIEPCVVRLYTDGSSDR